MQPDELHEETRKNRYCEKHELVHVRNALGRFVCPFCESNIDEEEKCETKILTEKEFLQVSHAISEEDLSKIPNRLVQKYGWKELQQRFDNTKLEI